MEPSFAAKPESSTNHVFSDPTLHEEDPMTSDWEGCKAAINEGKIATMVMGAWAVSQFQSVVRDSVGIVADKLQVIQKLFGCGGKSFNSRFLPICPLRST